MFYTDFILPFQISGIILFIAMISCITLTMRKRENVKRQNISDQNSKNKANSSVITNPPLNKGVAGI